MDFDFSPESRSLIFHFDQNLLTNSGAMITIDAWKHLIVPVAVVVPGQLDLPFFHYLQIFDAEEEV